MLKGQTELFSPWGRGGWTGRGGVGGSRVVSETFPFLQASLDPQCFFFHMHGEKYFSRNRRKKSFYTCVRWFASFFFNQNQKIFFI